MNGRLARYDWQQKGGKRIIGGEKVGPGSTGTLSKQLKSHPIKHTAEPTDLLYRNTKLYCNGFVFLHHYGKKPNDYLEIVLMFEHYLLSVTSDFPFAAKSLVRVLFF